jgi:hypothetical protein
LMVDIETMDVKPSAAIISIGACMFDPVAGPAQAINETFYTNISLTSNQMNERTISASTVEWWMQQSEEARGALLSNQVGLAKALSLFAEWFQHQTTYRPTHVWANSPSFDCVILQSAFESCRLLWPIGFWSTRDVRTAGELAYPNADERKAIMKLFRTQVGTAHNAKDDAVAQALFVAQCYHELKLTH